MLSGCTFIPFNKGPTLTFVESIKPIEYGSKVNLEDYIKYAKYDEMTISEYDPYTIGMQEITYSLVRNSKEKEYQLVLKTEDTQYPQFTKKAEELLILEGTEFHIENYFEAFHNVDGAVPVTIKEAVDFNNPGVFIVTAQARSKHGNETVMNFTLAIKSQQEYEAIVSNVESGKTPSTNTDDPPLISFDPPVLQDLDFESHVSEKPPVIEQTRPSNRSFMFADGYDIQTGRDACISYITPYTSFERTCIDIRNEAGFGIGYEAKFN